MTSNDQTKKWDILWEWVKGDERKEKCSKYVLNLEGFSTIWKIHGVGVK